MFNISNDIKIMIPLSHTIPILPHINRSLFPGSMKILPTSRPRDFWAQAMLEAAKTRPKTAALSSSRRKAMAILERKKQKNRHPNQGTSVDVKRVLID